MGFPSVPSSGFLSLRAGGSSVLWKAVPVSSSFPLLRSPLQRKSEGLIGEPRLGLGFSSPHFSEPPLRSVGPRAFCRLHVTVSIRGGRHTSGKHLLLGFLPLPLSKLSDQALGVFQPNGKEQAGLGMSESRPGPLCVVWGRPGRRDSGALVRKHRAHFCSPEVLLSLLWAPTPGFQRQSQENGVAAWFGRSKVRRR